MLMISGLEDTDGRNVEEVMQLEATEHLKKPDRACQKYRDKRIATVSLPEDKEHLETHLKYENTCTHLHTLLRL